MKAWRVWYPECRMCHIFIHLSIYPSISICICIYIYLHIYTYTYTYTYTYIYIYMALWQLMSLWQLKPLWWYREGTLLSWLRIYYADLAIVRFEHSVCCGSLMTTFDKLFFIFYIQLLKTCIMVISYPKKIHESLVLESTMNQFKITF